VRYGPVQPRLTFFHVLWLEGLLVSAMAGYWWTRHAGIVKRIAVTLLAGAAGFAVSGVAVFFLVTAIVIPRLKPDSRWGYEVDCYMRHLFGSDWQ
jgi:hypothetical protein